jgi:phosphoribosyl 1,2-cyclic phosphate phosphodiesterase
MTLLTATLLGCGPSPGVPRIGNDWGACDPAEPRNRRSRCSLLVERHGADGESTVVLVDTGPEVRMQLLAAGVSHIDGVLYTHAHADHIHGIDDLRAFWLKSKRLVDVYADAATAARLVEAFRYCFQTPPGSSYPPILRLLEIEPTLPFAIDGAGGSIPVLPFMQIHGDGHSLGFRFGGLAYSCDVSGLAEPSTAMLEGLDVWVVDALRHEPHPSHFSVAEALSWIDRLRPRRAVLTHMDLSLDYVTLSRQLPPNVEPGYDGMVLEFSDGA